jgi:hypothetical protein
MHFGVTFASIDIQHTPLQHQLRPQVQVFDSGPMLQLDFSSHRFGTEQSWHNAVTMSSIVARCAR